MEIITPVFQSSQSNKEKNVYTVISYLDIINLFANYKIPIAHETLEALKQHGIYFIKGKLDTFEK